MWWWKVKGEKAAFHVCVCVGVVVCVVVVWGMGEEIGVAGDKRGGFSFLGSMQCGTPITF